MRTRLYSLATLTLLALPRAAAQAPQYLNLGGVEVEVHGLQRWTAAGLNEALGRLSPGLTFASHTCAAVMRQFLHFGDAEVMRYVSNGVMTRLIVSVVEPEDSVRIRRFKSPVTELARRTDWGEAPTIIRTELPAMFALSYPRFLRGETDSIGSPKAKLAEPASLRLRAEIRRLNLPANRDTALNVLRTDATWENRMAAIWVLTNFADEPRVWSALLEAMASEKPMGYEGFALAAMASLKDGSVDLTAHEATLSALVGGTSLMQFVPAVKLLGAVKLDPSSARRIARAGRHLLLSNLQSVVPERREAVRSFLERASGERHGFDVEAWKRWLAD